MWLCCCYVIAAHQAYQHLSGHVVLGACVVQGFGTAADWHANRGASSSSSSSYGSRAGSSGYNGWKQQQQPEENYSFVSACEHGCLVPNCLSICRGRYGTCQASCTSRLTPAVYVALW